MGPFDGGQQLTREEEAHHKSEYARLVAENRARGLGSEEVVPPPPGVIAKVWGIVLRCLLIVVGIYALGAFLRMPARGDF